MISLSVEKMQVMSDETNAVQNSYFNSCSIINTLCVIGNFWFYRVCCNEYIVINFRFVSRKFLQRMVNIIFRNSFVFHFITCNDFVVID